METWNISHFQNHKFLKRPIGGCSQNKRNSVHCTLLLLFLFSETCGLFIFRGSRRKR